MSSANTLFLLYKHGLKLIDKKGVCESGLWQLTDEEQQMPCLSLHRSKSDRAYKGGKILDIREANDEEIASHYAEIEKPVPANSSSAEPRMIITFQIDRDWDVLWPEAARKNPMAHKGTGHVKFEAETE
jgi:hypothetical protein